MLHCLPIKISQISVWFILRSCSRFWKQRPLMETTAPNYPQTNPFPMTHILFLPICKPKTFDHCRMRAAVFFFSFALRAKSSNFQVTCTFRNKRSMDLGMCLTIVVSITIESIKQMYMYTFFFFTTTLNGIKSVDNGAWIILEHYSAKDISYVFHPMFSNFQNICNVSIFNWPES